VVIADWRRRVKATAAADCSPNGVKEQSSLTGFTYLTLREEGLIIDRAFEGMPMQRQKIASLEFAKNSWQY